MNWKKNSQRARLVGSGRHLRNARNMNRFLFAVAVIIIAGIFAGLRYQSKTLGNNLHPAGNSIPPDLQHYSGNKSFNENYQREKALKNREFDESFSQKESSGTELNVPTSDQASNMEDKLKMEKSLIHQEEGAVKDDGTKEVEHPKAIQASSPERQQAVSTPESPADRVDVKPLPKLSFVKHATTLENRWSEAPRPSFHVSNAAVIDAGSKQTTGVTGQLQGVGEIKKPQTNRKDQ